MKRRRKVQQAGDTGKRGEAKTWARACGVIYAHKRHAGAPRNMHVAREFRSKHLREALRSYHQMCSVPGGLRKPVGGTARVGVRQQALQTVCGMAWVGVETLQTVRRWMMPIWRQQNYRRQNARDRGSFFDGRQGKMSEKRPWGHWQQRCVALLRRVPTGGRSVLRRGMPLSACIPASDAFR